MLKSIDFLLDTRGMRNVNNNCFINCLIMAMFGYSKSPFYTIEKLDKNACKLYNIFKKIVNHVRKDLYPDISILRNFLPDEMRQGQQDSIETLDYFMKILKFEPTRVTMVRQASNDKKNIVQTSKNSHSLPYIMLDNCGEEDKNLIEEQFYPKNWDDLGPSRDGWLTDSNDVPKYRYTRTCIKNVEGDCLIFVVNRAASSYKRHSNKLKSPIILKNGGRDFFRFATILHLSSSIDFGHYITIIFDGTEHYVYNDMNETKIKKCKLDYSNMKESIERNSIMYFYYPIQ